MPCLFTRYKQAVLIKVSKKKKSRSCPRPRCSDGADLQKSLGDMGWGEAHSASMGHNPMGEERTTQYLGLISLVSMSLLRNHQGSSLYPSIGNYSMSYWQMLFPLQPNLTSLRPRPLLHTCIYMCMHALSHTHAHIHAHNIQTFLPFKPLHILPWLPQSGFLVLPCNPIVLEFPL